MPRESYRRATNQVAVIRSSRLSMVIDYKLNIDLQVGAVLSTARQKTKANNEYLRHDGDLPTNRRYGSRAFP